MKKVLCLVFCFVVVLTAFAGCSGGKTDKSKTTASAAKIDYDLSDKSENVAYSQIYDMIMKPDDFKGKTVKVKGEFEYADDELSGDRHYSCIVSDTQGCCQQGIEFVTKEQLAFEDYPVIYTEVEITGTFDTYTIGDTEVQCAYLKDATIKEL